MALIKNKQKSEKVRRTVRFRSFHRFPSEQHVIKHQPQITQVPPAAAVMQVSPDFKKAGCPNVTCRVALFEFVGSGFLMVSQKLHVQSKTM